MLFSITNNTDHQLPEELQSKIRLAVSICLLGLFIWLDNGPLTLSYGNPTLLIIVGYILFSTAIFFTIEYKPATSNKIRSVAIFGDICTTSLLLIFGGETAAPICVAYYILILNNGLSNYARELRIGTSLSILGFSSVLYLSEYWQTQTNLGIGLLVGMIVVASLISRHIHQDKTLADETVKNPNLAIDNKKSSLNIGKNKDLKILLITKDTTDRHMVLSYINSWGITLQVCNSTIRAFAELVNAAENGTGYTTVIVDSLNLDMDPTLFSQSLLSDDTQSDINLIHVSPAQLEEQEARLIAAGYSKLLNIPLDKTILFDAIHTTKTSTQQNSNITQLISHYSSRAGSTQPSDILLAISDPIEQKLLRSILEKGGQRVFTVSTGSQTLDALNTHQFDMVILDFNISDIDGKDIIRLYYYTYLNHDWVPFIALVDKATSNILSQCREAEVDAIIARPIKEQSLLMTIADIAASKAKQVGSINSSRNSIRACNTQIADNNDLILNKQTLRQLENLSSSSEFLDLLINNFHEDMTKLLNGLQKAIDHCRFTEFQDFAHALRDTSCNLGAISLHRLSIMALEINQHEFQQQGKPLLNELHLALSKTMHALRDHVIKNNDSATEKE